MIPLYLGFVRLSVCIVVLMKSMGYRKIQKHNPATPPAIRGAYKGASEGFCEGFKNCLSVISYPVK